MTLIRLIIKQGWLGILLIISLVCAHHAHIDALADNPTTRSALNFRGKDATDHVQPIEVYLFTEVDSVQANHGTRIVVGVRNNGRHQIDVSNEVVVQPIQKISVANRASATSPTDSGGITTQPSLLRVEVLVKGEFPNSNFGTTPVQSLRIASVVVPVDHTEYFPSSILGGFMQIGSYELEAVIYDNNHLIGHSAPRKVKINDIRDDIKGAN